jgi:hypothetical protein
MVLVFSVRKRRQAAALQKLFFAEGDDGVDAGGAPGWDYCGGEGYGGQQSGHCSEGGRRFPRYALR